MMGLTVRKFALVLTIAVLSILAISNTSKHQAYATSMIQTSSQKFFGPALEGVLVTDTSLTSSGDTIIVHVSAQRNGVILAENDVLVKNIGATGQFELYLTTSNCPLVPQFPFNPNATIVRINTSPNLSGCLGAFDNIGLTSPSLLQDGDSLVVSYGSEITTIPYSHSVVKASVSPLFSLSTTNQTTFLVPSVFALNLSDQDGIIDPTNFTQFHALPGLVSISSGTFNLTKAIFSQTSSNGTFSMLINVGGNSGFGGAVLTGLSLPVNETFTIHDKDNYTAVQGSGPGITYVPSGSSATSAVTTLLKPRPAPLFSQCPAIGDDTGCAILVVFNRNGTITTLADPNQGPYDLSEDTLIGVQNNLAASVLSMNVSGPNIFGFDNDGICGLRPFVGDSYCDSLPAGSYEGPDTAFTINDNDNGLVHFSGNGLAPGSSTFFSLENRINTTQFTVTQSSPTVTIIKHFIGGPANLNNVTLALDGQSIVNGTSKAVTAGQQQNITETYTPSWLANVYSASYADDCTDGVIAASKVVPGASLTCTITDTFVQHNFTVSTQSVPTGSVSSVTHPIDTVTIHGVNGVAGTFQANGTLSGPQGAFATATSTGFANSFPASLNITASATITQAGMYCWMVNVMELSGNYNSTVHKLIGTDNECFTIPTPIVQPTVTVIKHIDGGSAVLSDFTLMLNGSTVTNGTANTVAIGLQQNVSELSLPNYSASYSGDCDANGVITADKVKAGAVLECTITNTFHAPTPAPTVTIIKHIVGGTAALSNFTLTLNGTAIANGTTTTVTAGVQQNVSEIFNPASLKNQYNTTFSSICDNGVIQARDVVAGANLVCTITNTLIHHNFTVSTLSMPTGIVSGIVSMPNDTVTITDTNGTLASYYVNGTLTGPQGKFNSSTVEVQASQFPVSVNISTAAGTTISEPGTYCWSVYVAREDANAIVGVAAGSNDNECFTISSPIVQPTITVIKRIEGGSATIANVTLMINGQQVDNGSSTQVTIGQQQNVTESYNPSSLANEYTATFSGDCNNAGIINATKVTEGANLVCTITNTFNVVPPVPPTVTVIKHIDGGSAVLSDFTLMLNGSTVVNGTANTVRAGVQQNVSESNLPNYVGTFAGDCDTNGVIAAEKVVAGASLECTITNTFHAPPPTTTVTVIKYIVGGTATYPANFTLMLNGQAVANNTATQVTAGQQNISEAYNPPSLASQYTATFSGDCNSNGIINALAGSSTQCIITNTFVQPPPIAPTVTIIKHIDGGSAVLSDFTLMLNGSAVVNGTANTVTIGVQQNVSESSLANYVGTFAGDCDANGVIAASKVVDGANLTCIITNTFTPPTKSPAQAIQDLIALKESMHLAKGTATSLDAKLNAAYDSVTSGNLRTAANQLNAFIHEVSALDGKKLSHSQAEQLTSAAQDIIGMLQS